MCWLGTNDKRTACHNIPTEATYRADPACAQRLPQDGKLSQEEFVSWIADPKTSFADEQVLTRDANSGVQGGPGGPPGPLGLSIL